MKTDILLRTRIFSEFRLGGLKVQGKSFVHVVMELTKEDDIAATLANEDFTKNSKPIPASKALWAAR